MYHAERSQLAPISSYESPGKLSCLPPSEHVNNYAYPYSNLRETKGKCRVGESLKSHQSYEEAKDQVTFKPQLWKHPYFTKTGGDYQDLKTVKVVGKGVSTDRGRAFKKGRSNRPDEQKWI